MSFYIPILYSVRAVTHCTTLLYVHVLIIACGYGNAVPFHANLPYGYLTLLVDRDRLLDGLVRKDRVREVTAPPQDWPEEKL